MRLMHFFISITNEFVTSEYLYNILKDQHKFLSKTILIIMY